MLQERRGRFETSRADASQTCVVRIVRWTCGIFFLIGVFFATFVWVLIPLPIGIFVPAAQYQLHDIVVSLLGALLATSGYLIWFGWFVFALEGQFHLISCRSFMATSVVNHAGWLLFLSLVAVYELHEPLSSFWKRMAFFQVWIFINIVVALIGIFVLAPILDDDGPRGKVRKRLSRPH